MATALGLWLLLSSLPALAQVDELARHADALASARLEPAEARFVANVKLTAGPASFRLERGFLFPAHTYTGVATGEFVFVGRGSFECRPPNDLEADQLEVFTEQRTLEVDFSTALFAIGGDAVRQSLLDRPVVSAEAADFERATKRFGEWRGSRARVILGIDASLVRAALGEPDFGEFFAATVTTFDLGDVQFLVDPEASEQVSLGRFVPLEVEAREERKLRRALHREQRRERISEGTWEVVGRARQEAPYRYRYRLVPGEGGGLPRVLRYAEAQSSVSVGTWLPVPVEIGVFDPSLPKPKTKEKAPHASTPPAFRRECVGDAVTWPAPATCRRLPARADTLVRPYGGSRAGFSGSSAQRAGFAAM